MALLHPVFGQFQDHCEKSISAAEEFKLLDSIVNVVSKVYNLENDRKIEILAAFDDNQLPLFILDNTAPTVTSKLMALGIWLRS